MTIDSFNALDVFAAGDTEYAYYRLGALEDEGVDVARLPYALRVLLENVMRHEDGRAVTREHVLGLARWDPAGEQAGDVAFTPARVLLQDFTGVPAVVDLAAVRDALADLGGDPSHVNPSQPVELVIDHSIQADAFGTRDAFRINEDLDYERNGERYAFLKWGREAFSNFRVVPPNGGICHQVNLEHLARVVFGASEDATPRVDGRPLAFPDTLVGTDSHTPMVNGLGVLGWGVGGIEAEAAMLGQPVSMRVPRVVGVRLTNALPAGATATDLVLTVTETLRRVGVVGAFVEFFGPGVASLTLADRATLGNMSPEYGSTVAIFPVDALTLEYLRMTGRSEERVALVEAYAKAQGLYHSPDAPEPRYSVTVDLDLATVEPSVAGPKRPQDRIPLTRLKTAFRDELPALRPTAAGGARSRKTLASDETSHGHPVGVWGEGDGAGVPDESRGNGRASGSGLTDGSVVLAAITSCTNTSNPDVMVAAGLVAKKAAERGLDVKPWVKTTLAPGSLVVTEYLDRAGLTPHLERLGFHLVGYGCTTCIGNSGPLPDEVSEVVDGEGLVVASVLSGNRNFEGRIHSQVRANYLASPPLVVAFALAGRVDVDFDAEPLGTDADGAPVFLRDVWPTPGEIRDAATAARDPALYRERYARVFEGDARWRELEAPSSARYEWNPQSTYVKRPPFFAGMTREAPRAVPDVTGARALVVVGDSVTTDHVSPAGTIPSSTPAGTYLREQGVEARAFNSYGARRGNHEVMMRGTFANLRLRNRLVSGVEGGFTRFLPTDEETTIFEASERYRGAGTPLVVLAGKAYGTGSSRDWAAKGPFLLGVRVVVAESYERIHRSNLIGMGILPLQYRDGENAGTLGLTGEEAFDVTGIDAATADPFEPARHVSVRARNAETGEVTATFDAIARLDTAQEASYYRHGGILHYAIREILEGRTAPRARSPALAATPRPEAGREVAEDAVDEGSIESFPASDPPAY